MLHDAPVDVVIEHGHIRAEVRGLEVARVVVDDEGEARVEVGVGRHDRDAFTLVHGSLDTAAALASVIASVEAVRRPESERHPLRQLAPEGWLRRALLDDPSILGLVELRAVEPTLARDSIKDSGVRPAVGTTAAGEAVVVAVSVGIDLDLVPAAADARLAVEPEARLIIVLPERDLLPVTRRLAERLERPAEFVGLGGDWRLALEVVR